MSYIFLNKCIIKDIFHVSHDALIMIFVDKCFTINFIILYKFRIIDHKSENMNILHYFQKQPEDFHVKKFLRISFQKITDNSS